MGNGISSATSRKWRPRRKREAPPHAESSRVLFLLYLIHRTWNVVVEHVDSKSARWRGSHTVPSSGGVGNRFDSVSLAESDAGTCYSACSCSYCRLRECAHDCVRKENPLEIKHVKILRTFLSWIGAWPGEVLGIKVSFVMRYLKRYFLIQSAINMICVAHYLVHNSKNMTFFTQGQVYISLFMTTLTTIRISVPNLHNYGVLVKKYLMTFHLVHFRNKGEHYEKMYKFIDKISYYCSWCVLGSMIFGETLFNMSPIYQSYKIGAFTGKREENATVAFAVHWSFPGFDPADYFIYVTCFNFSITHVVSVSVCALDLLLYLMVFQIIGHVLLLRENFALLPKPKKQIVLEDFNTYGWRKGEVIVERFDAEENRYIRTQLAECVEHHRLIINFADDMTKFFGFMLAVNYLFHLLCCCLLLLECSQAEPEALVTFGPLTLIIFGQLIQISFIFEILGTVSEKLKDAVYDIPWECMDTGNRRTMCIMLRRMQTPITVTAMGMTPVGVTTMTSILKTTFTYFMFLKSIEE